MTVKIKKKPVYFVVIFLAILIPVVLIWLYSNKSFIEYDGVEMRPSADIADNLTYSPETIRFNTLLNTAGLTTFLHDTGPFTVFAPTEAAFTRLAPAISDGIQDPSKSGSLRQLLLNHVVKGKYTFEDLKDGKTLTTLAGEEIKVQIVNGYVTVNGVTLETYNIESTNGVIHMVSRYIVPEGVFE